MANNNGPGDAISRRLLRRAESSLHRRAMPDGGEVVTGTIARQALRAVGARAMTVDHTIFVDEGFDPSKPEDQALYAHERLHQRMSGGAGDDHDKHDAEESAAQAIERMVLHRARSGEDLGTILRDAERGAGATDAGGSAPRSGASSPSDGDDDTEGEAMQAYNDLLGQGLDHDAIVRMLTRFVVEAIEEGESSSSLRSGEHGGGVL